MLFRMTSDIPSPVNLASCSSMLRSSDERRRLNNSERLSLSDFPMVGPYAFRLYAVNTFEAYAAAASRAQIANTFQWN